MLAKVLNIYRNYYSTCAISKTKIMNIEKCYFRHNKIENKIDLTLLIKVKESVRQFNFSRKPTETVENLLTRIGANVQKVVRKGNKKNTADIQEIVVKIHNGDTCIPHTITCLDLFSLQGSVELQIQDNFYEAVFNVPWIESLQLPHSILSGFAVYPEYFSSQNTDKMACQYNWYVGRAHNDQGNVISDIHIQWEKVGTGFNYTPSVQDISKRLKLECIPNGYFSSGRVYAEKKKKCNGETTGPAVEVISKNFIEAGPGHCPFESRHMFTSSLLLGKSFRCITYNILADLYCDSDFTRSVLHPYCPPYALHIDYRKQLIIKELKGYNGDVICLQEVDNKIFKSYLYPILGSEGLKGLFYKKGKEVAEGLACFYREDRFSFLGDEHIVLAQALRDKPHLKPIWDAVQCNSLLLERVLDRSTVASATILQSRDAPDEILLVGNTHLYYHPDADHIRVIQGGIVIYWLQQIRNDLKKKNFNLFVPTLVNRPVQVVTFNSHPDKRVSLILCGDFNSIPSCGIYQLYTTGSAPRSLPDWSSKPEEEVQTLILEQEIRLGSACGTPQFTNFTAGFADCLDYIYYEKSNIEVEQVVPFPSLEELQAHTALPSIVFPSDHIALISDLRFTP